MASAVVDGAGAKVRLSFPNGITVHRGRDGFISTSLSTNQRFHGRLCDRPRNNSEATSSYSSFANQGRDVEYGGDELRISKDVWFSWL